MLTNVNYSSISSMLVVDISLMLSDISAFALMVPFKLYWSLKMIMRKLSKKNFSLFTHSKGIL